MNEFTKFCIITFFELYCNRCYLMCKLCDDDIIALRIDLKDALCNDDVLSICDFCTVYRQLVLCRSKELYKHCLLFLKYLRLYSEIIWSW